MEKEYLIPAGEAESKLIIKNSRFIGRAAFTPTVRIAKDFIRKVKNEYPGHSHVVYGYIIGYGNSVTCGMSDAGEPPGTAGRPVLMVVEGSGIGDITIVIVRFFGGTKLGKGGLVRAYSQAAKNTLEELTVTKKISKKYADITIAYKYYRVLEDIIADCHGRIMEKKFGTNVYCKVMVPEKNYEQFIARLKDVSGGKAEVRETGS